MALAGIKQKELIELVQQHFPNKGETEIRGLLNEAQRQLCQESGILSSWFSDTTVADTRFYNIDDSVITINRIELTDSDGNYFIIPRIINKPGSEE